MAKETGDFSWLACYKIRHGKKRALLQAYAICGNLTIAAQKANVHRTTHYHWLDSDKSYEAAFAEAGEHAADYLEQEAWRRAVKGTVKPVFYRGEQCGLVQEYSDTLLIFLLNGIRPEKFKQRMSHEHAGPGGGPIKTETNLSLLTTDELKTLESVLGKASADAGRSSEGTGGA